MTGVVLCGGESTRMGFDKGLMEYESFTWAELASNKLAELGLPVVLSVNERQYQSYTKRFSKSSIVKDVESLQVYGPLKGILSVHLQIHGEDLLVLACDMPAMNKDVLRFLVNSSSAEKKDVFAFKNDKQIEPLCAIYTAIGLTKIDRHYKQGQLKKHSLHYLLETVSTCYLPVPENWKKYFRNYNFLNDLNDL